MAEPQYQFDKIPYQISWPEFSKVKETYGGRNNFVIVDGMHYKPEKSAPPSDTVLIFMHPSGLTNNLALCNALPRAGVPVICAASRYPKNDSALIMEKVAIDMGAHVRHAKEKLGYKNVILAGWSGGGSLSMFYQSEAEKPEITHTPAGDEVDLTKANFMPADGVMQIATHVSRAHIMTEWIDVSIRNELDPDDRDPAWDLFGGQLKPPYGDAFFQEYRKRQIARSKRIDDFAFEMLEKLKKSPRGEIERCFIVHGTRSDPALFDTNLEPNDRKAEELNSMGNPAEVNTGPSGVARYTCLRSWLSQWSYAQSRVVSPRNSAKVSVPIIVIENSADDACMPSHPRRIYESVKNHKDSEMHVIKGATHYYYDQPEQLAESVAVCKDWLQRHNWMRG